ncbi:MAG: hypothetical protein ACR2KC_00320, partial [Acidimicrobiales bacterium]
MSTAAVLADLRRSRRRHRTEDFDPFEALYNVYITAIVSGMTVWLLSGVVGDQRVGAATLTQVGARGAQVAGAVVAAA